MKLHARVWLLMMVCGLVLAVALPSAAQAIGIEKFVATNCEEEECGEETVTADAGPPFHFAFQEPKPIATAKEKEELIAEGFTQAGGRVPFGVTDFLVSSVGAYPEKIPTAATTHIRTDVAPGLATNPFAVELCSKTDFEGGAGASPLASAGLFATPDAECEESEIGVQQATIYTGKLARRRSFGDVPVEGLVYDLETTEDETMRPGGPHLAALYGVAVKLPKFLTEAELKAHFEEEPLPGTEPAKKLTGRSPDRRTVVLPLLDQRQRGMGQRNPRDR